MSAKYTLVDNTAKVLQDKVATSAVFLRFALDEVQKAADPNTPKKMGNLRRDTLKQVLGTNGKIAWQKNYASIQESKQFKNYTTSGTGPHFAQDAVLSVVDRTKEIAIKASLI